MSLYMFVSLSGGSIGLLLGGALTQALDWHWIFAMNLPIGIVALAVGRALLDETRDRAREASTCSARSSSRRADARSTRSSRPPTRLDLAAHARFRDARSGCSAPSSARVAAGEPDHAAAHPAAARPHRARASCAAAATGDLLDVLLRRALPPARAGLLRARTGLAFLPISPSWASLGRSRPGWWRASARCVMLPGLGFMAVALLLITRRASTGYAPGRCFVAGRDRRGH